MLTQIERLANQIKKVINDDLCLVGVTRGLVDRALGPRFVLVLVVVVYAKVDTAVLPDILPRQFLL